MFGISPKKILSGGFNLTGAICEKITNRINSITDSLDKTGNDIYTPLPEEKSEQEHMEADHLPHPKKSLAMLRTNIAYGISQALKGSAHRIQYFTYLSRTGAVASRTTAQFINGKTSWAIAVHFLAENDFALRYLVDKSYPGMSAYARPALRYLDARLAEMPIEQNSDRLLSHPQPIEIIWNALKHEPRDIEENLFFSRLASNAAAFHGNIDALLKKTMDRALYDQLSDYTKEIKQDRYRDYRPSWQDDPLYFYANLRLLPTQLAAFLPVAGKAIDNLNVAMNEASSITDRIDAILNLITLIDPLNETFFRGVEPTYKQLRIADIPFHIPGFEAYKSALEQFLPVEKFLIKLRDSDGKIALIRDLFGTDLAPILDQYINAIVEEAPEEKEEAVPEEKEEAVPEAEPNDCTAVDTLTAIVKKHLENIDIKEIDKKAKHEITSTLNALSALDEKIKKYSQSDKKKLDLILFLISVCPNVYYVIEHGSQAYSSLGTAFHDNYLEFLNAVNAFFQDTCLKLDALETKFLIKDSFFLHYGVNADQCRISLYAFMEKFAALIKQETGFHNLFAFSDKNQFPYCDAILTQRKTTLVTLQYGYSLELASSLPKNDKNNALNRKIYISSDGKYVVRDPQGVVQEGNFDTRLIKTHPLTDNFKDEQFVRAILEITSHAGHTLREIEEKDDRAQEALNYRRRLTQHRSVAAELKKATFDRETHSQREEKNTLYFTKRNIAIAQILIQPKAQLEKKADSADNIMARRKLALLKALSERLYQNYSLSEALDAIKNDNRWSADFFLLWTGSTRHVMLQIEQICLTKDSYISHVKQTLSALRHARVKKNVFFPQAQCILLEQRIDALQQLCILLETPGHRPSYALEKLSARNPTAYSTLNRYDKTTINAIKAMENTINGNFDHSIANHLFGKILIDHQKPMVIDNTCRLSEDKINLIDRRIHTLEQEKKSFLGFFSRPTKTAKINLLKEVQRRMRTDEHISLQRVLDELANEDEFRSKMYLLHQGRTGQRIRELSGSELPRTEIIHRIDLEIARLCATRTTSICFFQRSRKQHLERHITALLSLKAAMAKPENAHIETNALYAQLDASSRQLLATHSRRLLEEIGATLALPEPEPMAPMAIPLAP